MSITALIPVREGSHRLKNKNILPFAGSNLLVHKIRQLKQVKEIDQIVVSSNSETMLKMAEGEGVKTHRRDEQYCDEVSAPFSEVVRNVCQNITGDHVLWVPCVAPLVEPRHYNEAIQIYLENLKNKNYDSLVTVRKFKEYLWDKNGSVNYDAGRGHVPSQELPEMWLITNGIFMAKREDMIDWGYLLGNKPFKYEIDKRASVDIDDDVDYQVALSLYHNEHQEEVKNQAKPVQKRNAVVIGATGNLGSVIAKTLAEEGFSVDPIWLSPDHPNATDPTAYKNLPDEIHCAIYVPGINIVKNTTDLTLEEWNRVMAVNLTGAFLFAQAAYPKMVKAKGATFAVISSIMGTHPYPRRLAYSTSKSGLEGFTRSLAVEWGKDKIATHCIRLGHLSTIMSSSAMDPKLLDIVKSGTPSGELIEPKIVADYIVWLANGGSRSVSGSVIDFDAGYTINRNQSL